MSTALLDRTKPAVHLHDKKAYSVAEAARLYGFTPQRIRDAIHSGALPAKQDVPKPGSKFRILAGDLDDWFRNLPDV